VGIDIDDPAELAAAEAAVAALPSRRVEPRRDLTTSGGRVIRFLTPFLALTACTVQGSAFAGGFEMMPYLASTWILVPATVLAALASGELGGRAGRTIGVLSGIAIVPPISVLIGVLPWRLLTP